MAILAEIPNELTKHTVLAYGRSKSGKTLAVGMLAELGYNLHWFDLEDGALTLQQLSPAAKARIKLYRVRDTSHNAAAAKTILPLLNYRNTSPQNICQAHGMLNCAACKTAGAAFDTIDISKLTAPKDIVVIDTLTQLSDSILNLVLKDPEAKAEFEHWRALGVKLDSFMDWMKAASCHVVVISHEQEVEMEDGKSKLTAVGGTRNYARGLPRHFSHVVYFDVVNNKHTAKSKSVALTGAITGSRTGADTGKTENNPLSEIFPKLV